MNKSSRSWWLMFGVGAAVMLMALAWVTVVMLQLERNELVARADANHQESLRLALWRMDSWLAPQLARESARPYFEYQSFYRPQLTIAPGSRQLDTEQLRAPSPLLGFDDDIFVLHFQRTGDGLATSPQAPQDTDLNLAAYENLPATTIDAKRNLLAEVQGMLRDESVDRQVASGEARFEEVAPGLATIESSAPQESVQVDAYDQITKSTREAHRRAQSTNIAQQGIISSALGGVQGKKADGERPQIGPLVPVWFNDDRSDDPQLMYLRRCRVDGQEFYQGILTDWPRLRRLLLGQITDLFPEADLRPVPVDQAQRDPTGQLLATIPVLLVTRTPALGPMPLLTPARMTLVLTWLAVGLAVVAASRSLGASIAFAQRRARFASAVTHELRTPLTTFRMYCDMLAEGMVDDPAKRQQYLDTLRDESTRLAGLVENVLAYAQVEEGRRPVVPAEITLGRLIDRLTPPLRHRTDAGQMRLHAQIEAAPNTPLILDVDAVEQILFNLVDNACKYAADADDRSIHLTARIENQRLTILVRDGGPGVPPQVAEAIFAPFERGGRDAADAVPGVGLGLALSRGLARDIGGDLVLEPAVPGGGACFKLSIPLGR